MQFNKSDLESKDKIFQSLDEQGNIVLVSDGWLKKLGYEREEVIGKFFGTFLDDKSLPQVQKNFPYLKDYGFVNNVPLLMKMKNGTLSESVLNGVSEYDEEGRFKNTICEIRTMHDILHSEMEVKKTLDHERFLRNALNLRANVLELMHDEVDLKLFLNRIIDILVEPLDIEAVYVADEKTVYGNPNETATEIINSLYPLLKDDSFFFEIKENASSENLLQLMEKANVSGFSGRAVSLKERNIYIFFFLNKIELQDEWRDALTQIASLFDYAVKSILNKEEKEELTKQLKESQSIAGLGSYTLDLQTGIWTSSEILDELFGIDQSYVHSIEGWKAIIHPDERIKMDNYFRDEVLAKAQPFKQEYRIVRQSDQSVRWVHGLGKLEFDSNGVAVKMLGTIQDVTEAKEKSSSLQKLSLVVEQSPSSIVITDIDGNIEYVNAMFTKVTGYSKDEALGQNPRILKSDETPQTIYDEMWATLTHGDIWQGELINLRKDNNFYTELATISPVKQADGRISNYVAIKEDITARKEMEKELHLKEEMMLAQSKQAAMGDMIAMIAHQWRQPLAVVGMNINNVKVSLELDGEVSNADLNKCANSVSKQILQLTKTIDDFRNFFKPEQLKENITIEDALDGSLDIIGTSLRNSNITLNIQNNSKSSLNINKSSLIQVLLSIIGNAKDVLLAKEPLEATINISLSETKEAVSISICDNGGGIPESIIDKIDQPYFTTKKELNGTGLGLYISRTIIKKHLGGTLTWHNEEHGACFVITLNIEQNIQKIGMDVK